MIEPKGATRFLISVRRCIYIFFLPTLQVHFAVVFMCMSYCTRFLHVRRLSLQLLFLVHHGQIGYDYLDTRSKLSQGLYSSINVCIPIAPPYTILVGAIFHIRYIEDSSVLLKDKNKEVRKKKFHYCDPVIIIPSSNYVSNIIYHHILENGCPLLFIPSSTQINNSRNIMMENIVHSQAKWIY